MDIRIHNIKKAYGEKTVLDGISLSVPAGRFSAVMGPSGCGKTTLFRILAGLEKADGGEMENLPPRPAYLFQENRLIDGLSPLDNLLLVKKDEKAARALLLSLGLLDTDLCKPCATLSGGMKRRVAIARALLLGGEFYLFDEPFRGLDEESKKKTAAVILAAAKGKTLLMITHDKSEADLLACDLLPTPFFAEKTGKTA